MSGATVELPLFPLHAVLCPGIALPLHVFEPRYRLMIERCLRASAPFGIVLIREGREVGGNSLAIAGVGTFAEIRQAERLPDGRFTLLVVGARRFAIEDVDADREPYLVGRVVPLGEAVGDEARVGRLADRLLRRFVDYLRLLQPGPGETAEAIDVRVEVDTEPDADAAGEAPGDSDPEIRHRLVIPDDPTVLSYLLGGIVQVPLARRQELLEADTTEERLVALHAVLDRELWLLARRLRLYVPEASLPAARSN